MLELDDLGVAQARRAERGAALRDGEEAVVRQGYRKNLISCRTFATVPGMASKSFDAKSKER
jgi:hypothetical protein